MKGLFRMMILCLATVPACGYFSIGARDNMQKGRGAEYNSSVITGTVVGAGGGPVMVLARPVEGGAAPPQDYVMLERPGPFMLYVPAGRYRLYSIRDYNGNGVFESTEVSGVCRSGGATAGIMAVEDDVWTGVVIREGAGAVGPLSPSFRLRHDRSALPCQPANGETARIYDERFCAANAEVGWWSPSTFMRAFGAAIYFTREYEPSKIPVLFVHGAQGSPQNWAYFLFRLDARRYQPWFYYYPSGIRLGLASRLLFEALKDLRKRFGFSAICITAHSMGGLITRDMLSRFDLKREGIDVKVYVTLASPWGGFESADRAFLFPSKRLPVWYDVTSASAFIDRALRAKLPQGVSYYLFYGTADGVAEGRALDERVYTGAKEKFAFDVDHEGILSDRRVFDKYREVLGRRR
ncbi:MAG: hypothetical protein JXA07_11145 [Spirochaetes bacterium]|nr:hypothetical protein [Spirochaetota bacterium]